MRMNRIFSLSLPAAWFHCESIRLLGRGDAMTVPRLAAVLLSAAVAACGNSEESRSSARGAACGIPAAPGELRGNPGPGPAQASLTWRAAGDNGGAAVERYIVYRNGQPFAWLGNTLVFGDTGASGNHSYEIAAVNACGVEGPRSAALAVSALPGTLINAPVSAASVAKPKLYTWKVLDAKGKEIGERTWRVVTGLGNCCETYVASDAAGRLYEYGGTLLYVSSDEGLSWKTVSNVFPTVQAEGAIVGAPGGDMLAVNWDPYTGDQLWSHKYVAATDTWYTARTPLHQPAFDRPWVAVIEGPFEIEGVIVPYISFLMSNYIHGDVLLMSLDGLHYQIPNTRELAELSLPVSLALPRDPARDWTQSIQQSSVFPLDNGFGLRDRHLLGGCAQAVLGPSADWNCPDWGDATLPPQAGEAVRIDSDGAIHVTTVQPGGAFVEHRVSRDGGRSWRSVSAKVPGRLLVEDWDVQVNAALDQVAISIHASASTDHTKPDQDMIFRIVGLQGDLRIKEILMVGDGNHAFIGSLGTGDRFDYTTVALLKSGRVVTSFGDRRHVPPAIAIETGE